MLNDVKNLFKRSKFIVLNQISVDDCANEQPHLHNILKFSRIYTSTFNIQYSTLFYLKFILDYLMPPSVVFVLNPKS